MIWAVLSVLCMPLAALELNREQCRELAIENNKRQRIAHAELERTRFEGRAFRANFLPKLSATGAVLFTDRKSSFTIPGGFVPIFSQGADGALIPHPSLMSYIPDTQFEFDLNKAYMAGISAKQSLYAGGRIRSAHRMALLGIEIAEKGVRKCESELLFEADRAYFTYLKTAELELVALKYEQLARELYRNIEEANRVGIASNGNLLKVRTKLNEAQLMLSRARNGREQARIYLCHVMGVDLLLPIEINDERYDLISEPLYDVVDHFQRAEYAILEKQVAVMRERVKLVRGEFLPSVGLMGSYGVGNPFQLNGSSIAKNGSASVVITLSVPLYAWGEGRNKVKAAKMEQKIAELKQCEANELMQLEFVQVMQELDEAFRQVERSRNALEAATENLRIAKDSYEVGLETLANYLEAQTSWQQCYADFVEAKSAFYLAESHKKAIL